MLIGDINNWPQAFVVIGIVFALAAVAMTFFWAVSRT
jgi:hypothetical protein